MAVLVDTLVRVQLAQLLRAVKVMLVGCHSRQIMVQVLVVALVVLVVTHHQLEAAMVVVDQQAA